MEMVGNVLRVSAKLDYAVRALAELAREAPRPVKGDVLATRQAIPFRFLEVTLGEFRQVGLVSSRRGSDGGYWLSRPAEGITLADISIAVEGGLVDLRAVPNGHTDGTAEIVREVWDAAHRQLGEVLGRGDPGRRRQPAPCPRPSSRHDPVGRQSARIVHRRSAQIVGQSRISRARRRRPAPRSPHIAR